MGEKTAIAWTDHTFNIAWGCFKWSPGCDHCYADTFAKRTGHKVWGPPATTPRRVFGEGHWREPLAWNAEAARAGLRVAPDGSPRPHLVFCSSMCDVFEDHPTIRAELAKLWPLIRATPLLHWQLLTKREDRIASSLPADWGAGYPNVWLLVSVDQAGLERDAAKLLAIPAVVHGLSIEPQLASVHLGGFARRLQWVINGGESVAGARPFHLEWARSLVAECRSAGTAIYMQKLGCNPFECGQRLRLSDYAGGDWNEWPNDLRIRQFPIA